MKNIFRTIALILVLIMLAGNFTGCTLFLPILGLGLTGSKDAAHNGLIYGVLIDILSLGLIYAGLFLNFNYHFIGGSVETETGIYPAHAGNGQLTEDNIFIEKLKSLPEAERNSFMEKLNSMPEEKRADLFRIIAFLPETEIASASERINALSDAEFASAARLFSSLSETELDLAIDMLRERATSKPKIITVAAADYPPVYAYAALRLQY